MRGDLTARVQRDGCVVCWEGVGCSGDMGMLLSIIGVIDGNGEVCSGTRVVGFIFSVPH